ncbi:hypothetical protein CBR_g64821 [Chara braunii]|uniref:Uncharacterized protein n=1 Tax=Chara braunii TaxID=69332 RepID=A0A388K945_CHABU|nr:hypothetical protein CBR_g64821 [Chara braunii]|eukprot:GBG66551.1 hypothetical protein CBR_g64821 [Chara braunii]
MATSAAAGGAAVSQVGSSGAEQGLDSPVLNSMPGQQPGEYISDFAARVLTFSKVVAEEEQWQAEAAATLRWQQQEVAEAQHRQQEAAADAVQCLRQESATSLLQEELEYAAMLRAWHFTPPDGHNQRRSTKRQRKKFPSSSRRMTCKWQQHELQRLERVIGELRDSQGQANRSIHAHLDRLKQDNAASASAAPSNNQPSTRQLEQRIVVATIGDLGTLAESATISHQIALLTSSLRTLQQRPSSSGEQHTYKMPNFNIEKFDGYTKQNTLHGGKALPQN